MKNSKNLLKNVILIAIYILLLQLYLANDLNKHLLGIISDSFWLTGVSTLFIIFLLQNNAIKVNDSFYCIHKIEYSGKIYKTLSITVFKKVAQRAPLPFATQKMILHSNTKTDILALEQRMRNAEIVHVYGFMLVLILTIFFAWLRDMRFLLWFTLFNIIFKLYLVFLQRYNRNRIRIILGRK